MKENNDKELSSIRDRFKMDPPENAWSALDADLEKKQAFIYKQRGNRFKLLSIGLALLLISSITYYYISRNQNAVVISSEQKVTDSSADRAVAAASNTPSVPANINTKKNKPADANHDLKGGFGTRGLRRASQAAHSSSFHKIERQEQKVSEQFSAPSTENPVLAGRQSETKTNDGNETGKNDSPPSVSENKNPEQSSSENDSDNTKASQSSESSSVSQSDNGNNVENQKPQDEKPASPPAVTAVSDNAILKDSSTDKSNSKKSPWSIDAFYSPNYYAKNNLEAANASGYGQSAADYSMREKSDYSFATGLSLRYNLTEHWSVSVGGTYSTIAYSINLPTVYAQYNSEDELYYLYPTSCGNIEIPTQSNTVAGDSLTVKGTCVQVIKILSIPVTARYQVVSDRFTFYADAGFSVNIVTQAKSTLNIGNSEMTILNNVDGLSNMNYGYLFGGGVEYALNNGWGLFVEPSFRGSITSLTQNIAFYCYPVAFSLNTGIALHF